MSTQLWYTYVPLQTATTERGIEVAGTTFRYVFSHTNGLLSHILINGKNWLSRATHVPDLWAAEAVHPRGAEFTAARETRARVHLEQSTAERVIIRAQGRYLDRNGVALALEYRLRYVIDVDGVICVDVENHATGSGALRWLAFSRGSMPATLVDFVNYSEDLAQVEARTGGFDSAPVPASDGTVLAGRFYPWLQLGNDRGGIDLTVDIADEMSFGHTDSMPYFDGMDAVGALCHVARAGRQVNWEHFAIRNLYTPLRPSWSRRNRFYLAVVPARPVDPRLSDIRVHWLGPHQINPKFVYPTEAQIADWARQGINLLLGCAHWRSGEYSRPREPEETERVIRACHDHGMRIIPYLTFTDLNHQVPAFQQHGQEWQIEPVAEFKHLTNLMCYAAEGWRQYWKSEVDAAWDRFDFDGLYIDFWVGKMACTNPLHGCRHRYGRYTLPGLRDMARHAFGRVKERDGFILANTNMGAGALINNLVDIRLPGEWGNIEETSDEVVRGYLNSRRLGCNALLLTGSVPRLTRRSISLGLRCQSSMTAWRGRSDAERRLYMQYADILRSFGTRQATASGAWEDDGTLRAVPSSMVHYHYRNTRGVLLVGVDTVGTRGHRRLRVARTAALGLRPKRTYLVYRPDQDELVHAGPRHASRLGWLGAELRDWEPLLMYIGLLRGISG